MEKFHIYKWNQREKEFTMVILTEEDIENEVNLKGAGFELLVLPRKYENVENKYLDFWKEITYKRYGNVIYV